MTTQQRHEVFETGPSARLVGDLRAADTTIEAFTSDGPGQVSVTVEASGSRAVEALSEVRIEQDGSRVLVEIPKGVTFFGSGPRYRVRVTVPAGSTLDLATGSGDVTVRGPLGDAAIRSGSGDLRVDEAAAAELRTGSGDVSIGLARVLSARTGSGDLTAGRVEAGGRLATGSGDVRVDSAHDIEVTCGSGHIGIGSTTGTLRLRSGSGGIAVARAGEGALTARSGSGSIRVAVVPGISTHLDVSSAASAVHSTLEPAAAAQPGAATLLLDARAASGSVFVDRAG